MTASSRPPYNLCQCFQVKLVFSNTFAEHSEPAVTIYISKDGFSLFFDIGINTCFFPGKFPDSLGKH